MRTKRYLLVVAPWVLAIVAGVGGGVGAVMLFLGLVIQGGGNIPFNSHHATLAVEGGILLVTAFIATQLSKYLDRRTKAKLRSE